MQLWKNYCYNKKREKQDLPIDKLMVGLLRSVIFQIVTIAPKLAQVFSIP